MKYFTRQRFLAIQQDSAKAERDWKKASAHYARHLRNIRERLPKSGRQLSGLTFHDGIVRSVRRALPGTVRLVVDASNNPWGPRGKFELRFTGVRAFTMRGRVVGDWWLYDEVHASSSGFSLHVLLHRSSFVIAASEFALLPIA